MMTCRLLSLTSVGRRQVSNTRSWKEYRLWLCSIFVSFGHGKKDLQIPNNRNSSSDIVQHRRCIRVGVASRRWNKWKSPKRAKSTAKIPLSKQYISVVTFEIHSSTKEIHAVIYLYAVVSTSCTALLEVSACETLRVSHIYSYAKSAARQRGHAFNLLRS